MNDMSDLRSLMPKVELGRRGFVMTSLAVGFAAAAGPVAAQTVIKTDSQGLDAKEVKIPAAGGDMPAYVAMPAAGANFPTVLVVQEIFGVHEYIKDTCRRFAKAGYMAIAPELYARQGDPSKYTMQQIPDLQRDIVAKVPDSQVLGDLDACLAYAEKSGKMKAGALAVTGFCWGGRIVWLYAAHQPKLKAGVAWYGRLVGQATPLQPKHPIDVAKDLKAPVLGLYGGADQGIPNDTVEMMQAELKKLGKPSEIVLYPGMPHGFHADFRATYREQAAKDGWDKLMAWYKKHGAA
jgi:carboxymethylenebutenolidase